MYTSSHRKVMCITHGRQKAIEMTSIYHDHYTYFILFYNIYLSIINIYIRSNYLSEGFAGTAQRTGRPARHRLETTITSSWICLQSQPSEENGTLDDCVRYKHNHSEYS